MSHSRSFFVRRGFSARFPVVLMGLCGLWAIALTGSAAALPSNCAEAGTTVTCTYSAGSEGMFAVPLGADSVHVVATAASGATTFIGVGGAGAQVTSNLAVTPGGTLYVEVDIGGAHPAVAEPLVGVNPTFVRVQSAPTAARTIRASSLRAAAGAAVLEAAPATAVTPELHPAPPARPAAAVRPGNLNGGTITAGMVVAAPRAAPAVPGAQTEPLGQPERGAPAAGVMVGAAAALATSAAAAAPAPITGSEAAAAAARASAPLAACSLPPRPAHRS
jgi:hypothetical protein